jgi:hypothetical protein
MTTILWHENDKIISDSLGSFTPTIKPEFGFVWNEMIYLYTEKKYTESEGGEWLPLTDEQITTIESTIEQIREEVGPNTSSVDVNGYYLGSVVKSHPDFYLQVDPPVSYNENWCYDFTEEKWKIKYFFDVNGQQTNKEDSVGGTFIEPTHIFEYWNVVQQKWELKISELNYLKEIAIFNSIKSVICGTVKFIYSQNLDGKNLDVFDLLKSLSNSTGQEISHWLSNKELLDSDLEHFQSILSKQNSSIDTILASNTLKDVEDELTSLVNLIYSIEFNGCRTRTDPLEYPNKCN